jgi:hypothetical protein
MIMVAVVICVGEGNEWRVRYWWWAQWVFYTGRMRSAGLEG